MVLDQFPPICEKSPLFFKVRGEIPPYFSISRMNTVKDVHKDLEVDKTYILILS